MTNERPQRTDARRNRDRLVAVAGRTFAELGPDASLNRIAQAAGVGPGTLYRHFPSRRELLAAVLEDRITALCARADELAAEPPDAALTAWLRAFLDHARTNQGLGGAFWAEPPGDLDCHARIRAAARSVLARAQRDGTARPDLSVPDLLQLVVGIALATAQDDGAQAGRLLTVTLDGVFRA